MLIVIASVKGSPGATTLAVALGAVWPGEPALVVELDCAGGDLSARHWLPDSPGVATLAAQTRSGFVNLAEHVTRLRCGVDVVLGAAGRHPASAAAGLLMEADLALWAKERPTIADVGRLEPGAPAAALVGHADAVLLVTSGDAGSLLRLTGTGLPADRTQLVLVGASQYAAPEITASAGLPVAAQIPWDAHAAAITAGERRPRRGWTRRGMPAAARALAVRLAALKPRTGHQRQNTRPGTPERGTLHEH